MRGVFSRDGTRLATSGANETVILWDARTGDRVTQVKIDRFVRELAFTPDGKHLATRADRVVTVWGIATGAVVSSMTGHVGDIYAFAFSPDGTRLATGSNDRSLRIWDVRTGQEVLNLEDEALSVWSVAFSPDGTKLAAGRGNGTVRIYDAAARLESAPPPRAAK